MSVAASLLSIVLFLAFASSGLQKIGFNPATSKSAERLNVTKRNFQRIGVLEVLGALALLVGLVATGASVLAVLNEVAAGCLALLMAVAVAVHLRQRDAVKYYAPALALGLLAVVELVLRVLS